MCKWEDRIFPYARGSIQIPSKVISDACEIIRERAQAKRKITYSEMQEELKKLGHRKINRGTVGKIVGEVSVRISQITNPSIYPSAIVVRKDTGLPGNGFWGVDTGTNPPSTVSQSDKLNAIRQYQKDVFEKVWNCRC